MSKNSVNRYSSQLNWDDLREKERLLKKDERNTPRLSSNSYNNLFEEKTRESERGNPYQSQLSRGSKNSFSRKDGNSFSDKFKYVMKQLPLWALIVASFLGELFKSILIVLGVMAINIADSAMGALALSLVFSGKVAEYTFLNDFYLGSVFSLGLSAVQIYMWMLIKKRGITWRLLTKDWKRVPADVKNFLYIAISLWAMDTFIDTSPLDVILTNENFVASPILYKTIVLVVYIITVLLCGFAEPITTNMKEMFETEKTI